MLKCTWTHQQHVYESMLQNLIKIWKKSAQTEIIVVVFYSITKFINPWISIILKRLMKYIGMDLH